MSKILLIEDDETMRDGMSQVLRKAGHEVVDVPNGPAGVLTGIFKFINVFS